MHVVILRLVRPVFGACQPPLYAAVVARVPDDVACAASVETVCVSVLLTSSLSTVSLSLLWLTFKEPSRLFSVALPNDTSSKVLSLEGDSVFVSLEAAELERTGKAAGATLGSSVLGSSSVATVSQISDTVSVSAM